MKHKLKYKCDTCVHEKAEETECGYTHYYCAKDHWDSLGDHEAMVDPWANCADYKSEDD